LGKRVKNGSKWGKAWGEGSFELKTKYNSAALKWQNLD
jgi:hypothetical protein